MSKSSRSAHTALLALAATVVLTAAMPTAAAEPDTVTWGNEQRGRTGQFRRPVLTPDPDRLEVLHFTVYTPTWTAIEPVYQAWKASLPDTVDVVMLPLAGEGARGRTETLAYYTARELGRGAEAHAEIARQLARPDYTALGPRERAALLSAALELPANTFAQTSNPLRESVPEAHARWALQHHMRAFKQARLSRVKIPRAWPTIIVNGRYILDTHRKPNPAATYRKANRLIRQAIEAGPAHDGPTNLLDFVAIRAPHSGDLYRNRTTGTGIPFVYNINRHTTERWLLSNQGAITKVETLVTDDGAPYFASPWQGKTFRLLDGWRHANDADFVRARGGGNQRYAAFLFTDWLSEPDRLAKPYPFKGETINVRYNPDGTASTIINGEPVKGRWWLEAGDLRVSFGEHGTDYWPWQVAAHELGFKAPKRSLPPGG